MVGEKLEVNSEKLRQGEAPREVRIYNICFTLQSGSACGNMHSCALPARLGAESSKEAAVGKK